MYYYSIATILLPYYYCILISTLVENRPLIHGPNQALVPAFFAPGTRETFSPGWWLQPGLKVPAQRLLRQAVVAGDL